MYKQWTDPTRFVFSSFLISLKYEIGLINLRFKAAPVMTIFVDPNERLTFSYSKDFDFISVFQRNVYQFG